MSIVGGAAAASSLLTTTYAYIQVLPPGVPGEVRFPFNPDELRLSYASNYCVTPQPADIWGGTPQFQGPQPASIPVKIKLHTYSVPPSPPKPAIDILKQAMLPTEESKAQGDPKPPFVTFGWGENIIFAKAYIESMNVTYKQFFMGLGISAEVDVTLTEAPMPLPGTNPTSGGLASRRSHLMVEGDSLASVAHREYGSPARWRALAVANGIDDPMRVRPGTVLIVPDQREADALA
jgi:nucleoid-associated protein YgaU